MSISSCPRCAKQVTLPTGVSHSVQVRCPLCHAQYPLADALVNMPPLLEVIEELHEGVSDDGLNSPPQREAESHPDVAEPASAFAVDVQNESDANQEAAAASDLGDAIIASSPAESPALEFEHDDFTMQEKDTEVEDLTFNASDPLEPAATVDFEPSNDAVSDDELVFDLDEPAPSSAQPVHDEAAQGAPGDSEIEIDFGEPQPVAEQVDGEAMMLDFGSPENAAEAGHEAALDFGSEEMPLAHGDADDIVPDFGQPTAAPITPVTAESKDPPAGKSKKEKPKKKPAEPKSGDGPARKRSLVSTLTNVVLPGVVTVPLVIYALLWLGPKYDYLGMGPKLPGFMVPAAFNKPKQVAATTQAEANEMVAKAIPQLADAMAAIRNPDGGAAASNAAAEPLEAQPAESAAEDESAAPGAKTGPSSAEPPADAADEKPEATPDAQDDAPKGKPAADEDAPEMPDKPARAAADDLDSLLDDPKPAGKPAGPAELAEPADAPAEPAEVLGPLNAPAFTSSDLAKALEHTNLADKKMTAAQVAKDEVKFKKARMDFYLSLYGLANVTTFVKDDAGDSQLDDQRHDIEQLAEQFAADPKRLDALKNNATRWLAFSKRTTPGIVLAGMVQGVEEVGKLYHVKVQVGEAADSVVTVVCGKDPRLESDDQVFTLGTIVAHPEEELAGYDGSDTVVVWSGMTLKIPVDGK